MRRREATDHSRMHSININRSLPAGTRLGDRSGRPGGADRRVDGGDCYKQPVEPVRLRVQPRAYT